MLLSQIPTLYFSSKPLGGIMCQREKEGKKGIKKQLLQSKILLT